MAFILSSENVLEYLQQQQVCHRDQVLIEPVKSKKYKNFSLVVSVTGNNHYLVKQERFKAKANTDSLLKYEWVLRQLLNNFPHLQPIQSSISEVVKFDSENSIIVIKYLPEYTSLDKFYQRKNDYPTQIAALLGTNLAQLHRLTFNHPEYREFLSQHTGNDNLGNPPNFLRGLERVGPGIFANICSNGIEFFKLYQRFPSLHQAVAELHSSYQSACLIHSDLRFSNYLVENQDSITSCSDLKLIDWEFLDWGDPAFDLGILIAKYLKLWLDSLLVDSSIDINLALSLATCPLEKVQPSLTTLLQTYLAQFPEILKVRPNFVDRVIQFAGLNLIKHIQHNMEQHEPFDNGDICTLQVAKNLLSDPEESKSTIFGLTETKVSTTV